MNAGAIKKSYLSAAVAAAGIIGAIIFYAVVAEVLSRLGHKPPLVPPAAYAVKYALYLLAVSALLALKLASARLGAKKATPEETLKALTVLAIVKAALCELPAIAGLILFVLTGYKADFYLLLVFAAGLEIYHFPRLASWEERLRADFGQL